MRIVTHQRETATHSKKFSGPDPFKRHGTVAARWKNSSNRECAHQPVPTSIIGVVELCTHERRGRTHYEQMPVTPNNEHLRMGALVGSASQWWQEHFLGVDRGAILDIALRECDIVMFVCDAGTLIWGSRRFETQMFELWSDELRRDQVTVYEPRRSGGKNSRYYRKGYSKVPAIETPSGFPVYQLDRLELGWKMALSRSKSMAIMGCSC